MTTLRPGTPSIPLSAELQALEEVLEIARHDLHTLLTRDHPTPGADILIEKERARKLAERAKELKEQAARLLREAKVRAH